MLTAIFKRPSYEERKDNVAEVALSARHRGGIQGLLGALLEFRWWFCCIQSSAWLRLARVRRWSRTPPPNARSGSWGRVWGNERTADSQVVHIGCGECKSEEHRVQSLNQDTRPKRRRRRRRTRMRLSVADPFLTAMPLVQGARWLGAGSEAARDLPWSTGMHRGAMQLQGVTITLTARPLDCVNSPTVALYPYRRCDDRAYCVSARNSRDAAASRRIYLCPCSTSAPTFRA